MISVLFIWGRVRGITASERDTPPPRFALVCGGRGAPRALDVKRVSAVADACRDIDTPADVAWWEEFLSN